jgi:hypothetical protein
MLISIVCIAAVFDGAMVVLAIFTLNLFHPSLLFCGLDDALEKDIDEQPVQDSHSA